MKRVLRVPFAGSSRRCLASTLQRALALGLCTAGMAACTSAPTGNVAAAPSVVPAAAPAATTGAMPAGFPEIKPGVPAGYLGNKLPDSLLLLPPPPADDGAAFRNDQAVHDAAQALKGTPRYTLASSDANLSMPHAPTAFECALGVPITPKDTPRLYLLLVRVMVDAGLGTYAAKNHYNRIRPFVHYNEHTCYTPDEAGLRHDGSYPSGHTSLAWAWALVLSDLAPERTNALLARGRAFGENRLVCNAHWQSDVLEGRAVGAGVFGQLQSDATYQADIQAARGEIAAQRSAGKPPSVDCTAEAAALAVKIPGVL